MFDDSESYSQRKFLTIQHADSNHARTHTHTFTHIHAFILLKKERGKNSCKFRSYIYTFSIEFSISLSMGYRDGCWRSHDCSLHEVGYTYAYVRGLHGPNFSVQARPGSHGYDLGPARPEAKKKVSALARPGP